MLIDVCESRLTVHLAVNNIRNMDAPIIGKSDPFAVLYLDNTGSTLRPALINDHTSTRDTSATHHSYGKVDTKAPKKLDLINKPIQPGRRDRHPVRDTRWQRIGATETVRNSHNAVFTTSFEIPYFFERAQRIAVDVYDRDVKDSKDDKLSMHDFLGCAEMSVPSVVRAKGKQLTVALHAATTTSTDKVIISPTSPTVIRTNGTIGGGTGGGGGGGNVMKKQDYGTLTVAMEEVTENKQRIHYSVTCEGVSKNRSNGPFLTILRKLDASSAIQQSRVDDEHHGDDGNGDDYFRGGTTHRYGRQVVRTGVRGKNERSMAGSTKLPSMTLANGSIHSWVPVFRSEGCGILQGRRFIMNEISHNYEKLTRCDDNVALKFEVSYKRSGKHETVASGISTLAMAEKHNGHIEMDIMKASKSCLHGGKKAYLTLSNKSVTEDVTFLDYIIGGCEISLVIGIDFTASNGDPSQEGSFHFLDSMQANEYENAIRAVGDILACYDSDQMFPVFGFGAKLPPHYNYPSHCFTMTHDTLENHQHHQRKHHHTHTQGQGHGYGYEHDGEEEIRQEHMCYTIDGVLNAYRHALYNIRLSGPTVFAEIVQAAADHARDEAARCARMNKQQSYTILLMVTDGVINDVQETLDALYQASSLPMSVVIIGVGAADFSDMVLLDGDDEGRERDIVQFVNYRQYRDAPEVLRAKVLEEIPRQLLQYMRRKNIAPNVPPDE